MTAADKEICGSAGKRLAKNSDKLNETNGLQPVGVAWFRQKDQVHSQNRITAALFSQARIVSTFASTHDVLLGRLKEISGRRIEAERRRQFLTQRQFASRTRISIRWLREIESGNPGVKLDDHLRCGAVLGLAPSYIFLPLLYEAHGRSLPIDISRFDLTDVEHRCMQLIERRMKPW